MRQAWHIFKKDARYLRREICLVAVLAAMFARMETPWWAEMLLLVSAGYLIARLIHAEAIPGDRQFWITRPYRWKSLLGAKLLFIVVFVNLPILLAQGAIVLAAGFPLGSSVPGLLWSQVLMFFVLSLPVAALAAVTASIVPFIFAALVLLAIGFSTQQMMFPRFWLLPPRLLWPGAVEWVRNAIAVLLLVAMALSILFMQYRSRRTLFSRTFALGATVLGVAAYWWMPWPLGFAAQSRLSKQPPGAAAIQAAFDPSAKIAVLLQDGRGRGSQQVRLLLPIVVSGVPAGLDVRADALAVTLQGTDGRTWRSGLGGMNRRQGESNFEGTILMSASDFGRERARPVTLRASVYLALFGKPRARTIPLQASPVNVTGGLQCYVGDFDFLFCRSAFRWPARLVYVRTGPADLRPINQAISYSPFPASLSLDPIEGHWASKPPSAAAEATIVVEEPLAHLRRDLEARGIRLADFARKQGRFP